MMRRPLPKANQSSRVDHELLLYSAILTCMQYLFCYDVMSMMQCMYDVWLCHEFCALCGITLMLCI